MPDAALPLNTWRNSYTFSGMAAVRKASFHFQPRAASDGVLCSAPYLRGRRRIFLSVVAFTCTLELCACNEIYCRNAIDFPVLFFAINQHDPVLWK